MASRSDNLPYEDAAAVRNVQEGDVSAFEHLVIKYQDRIYNLCLRMVGQADNARDLTQETFLKAFDGIGRFQGQSSFYTWLFRIAVNLSISFRRRERSARIVTLDAEDEDSSGGRPAPTDPRNPQPIEAAGRKETIAAVAAALQNLDEDHRAVLVLRDVESMDYQTISEILQLPLGTVRSRLHRARVALKDMLRPVVEKAG